MNSVGQPAEQSPDGVIITKYFSGDNTSNGLITLDGLAEKSKSIASRYDLVCLNGTLNGLALYMAAVQFFCVMKGKVLVTVNSVQYTLVRQIGIRVPQGIWMHIDWCLRESHCLFCPQVQYILSKTSRPLLLICTITSAK